ncbi:MAG: hypothetical protein ACM3VZ_01495 [Acidobacteriota bacterium]
MMKCKDYVFRLTSGQLQSAPADERIEARLHWMVCRHCRAFTRNDARLDAILTDYKGRLQSPQDADGG